MKMDFDKLCPNWMDFLRSFNNLDPDALRDFLRRCLHPDIGPAYLVVLYDNDSVRLNLENMLEFLLPRWSVSAPKHYSMLKKNFSHLVTLVEGVPSNAERCQKFKKVIAGSKSKILAFAKKLPDAPVPPHTLADLTGKKDQVVKADDFRDQIEGLKAWIDAPPKPRPIKTNWSGHIPAID